MYKNDANTASGHAPKSPQKDEALLMKDPGVSLTRLGMVCNLVIALSKIIGGWAFNSSVLTADGWHSVTDLTSDVLTLVTLFLGLKAQNNARFKPEDVEFYGSIVISTILLFAASHMGWESLNSLYDYFNAEPTAGHAITVSAPSIYAAGIAFATVLVKEWLYHASESTYFTPCRRLLSG
jgi:divalent metal cation (Fe/Co/Zn/Cd) transporter